MYADIATAATRCAGATVDFDFRPAPYDAAENALRGVIASIQGTARRDLALKLLQEGRHDELSEFLQQERLSEEQRKEWGRVHPSFMGGEFLPPTSAGEVEIARLSLQSTLGDVVSFRARRTPKGWNYRVVDEYPEDEREYEISPEYTVQPLTLGELIRLMDGTVNSMWQGMGESGNFEWTSLVIPYLESQLIHGTSMEEFESLFSFAKVSSEFYPDLQWYYGAVTDRWCEARLVDLFALKTNKDVPALIADLHDWDREVSSAAARRLRTRPKKRVVQPLIGCLADGDWNVRCAAAELLGRIGAAEAADALIGALSDPDIIVRRAAADALGRIHVPEIPFLRALTLGEWKQVAATGSQAVPQLIAMLGHDCSDVRRGSANTLGEIRDADAVEPLIRSLRDADDGVRSSAAAALGRIGDCRAVGALIEALSDTCDLVRRGAASALGEIRDARAVEPLLQVLADATDRLRSAAAEALGSIGDTRAAEPLLAAAERMDADGRWAVAQALNRLRDPHAVPLLIESLGHADRKVRLDAVEALEISGDDRAIEPLEALGAVEEDEEIQDAVAGALWTFGRE